MYARTAPKAWHALSVSRRAQVEGCAPVDLLPSLFVGQCGSCSAVAALRWARRIKGCGNCKCVEVGYDNPILA